MTRGNDAVLTKEQVSPLLKRAYDFLNQFPGVFPTDVERLYTLVLDAYMRGRWDQCLIAIDAKNTSQADGVSVSGAEDDYAPSADRDSSA